MLYVASKIIDKNNQVIYLVLDKKGRKQYLNESDFNSIKSNLCDYNKDLLALIVDSNNNIFEYNTIKSLKSCIDVNNFRSTFNMNWLLKNFGEEARIKFIQMLMFDYINCDIGV